MSQTFFSVAQIPFGHENAIYKDSSIYVSWATGCTVHRGYQNIADTSIGLASVGDSSDAIGKADVSGTVSLGDGGYAILTFDKPITNGYGPDFSVFENGFQTSVDSLFFLELAFVEVSSDGINFFRFHSSSTADTVIQMSNADGMNPKKLNNFAGKYMAGYGTPFDLEELKNISGLDVNHITHVKIIDVVGSMNDSFARRDFYNRKVNDPWPTPFLSSGFDLDAVGVINQISTNGISEILSKKNMITVFPIPATKFDLLHVNVSSFRSVYSFEISDMNGNLLMIQPDVTKDLTIDLSEFKNGIYVLRINSQELTTIKKIIIE